MFKVVADQLTVAQGWVRCGQCGKVFEASLHLVEDDRGAAEEVEALPSALQDLTDKTTSPPQAISFPAAASVNSLPAKPADRPAGIAPKAPGTARNQDFASAAADAARMQPADGSVIRDVSGRHVYGEKPAMQPHPEDAESTHLSVGDTDRHEPNFNTSDFDSKSSGLTPQSSEADHPDSGVRQDSQAFPDVAFVREAQRRDFWKSPLVRTVLAVICLALALALTLQWVVRQKDLLAVQMPQLAPWLQAICQPLGCTIRPLRRIESLVIENSNFSRTGPDAYRLSFTFNNTGDAALEIPALEVTLTDSHDQAVVRRVVMPADFGAKSTTLAAYSKLAGVLTLKVNNAGETGSASPVPAGLLPVAGYRILAFYP